MKSFLGTHRRCTASVALASVSSLLVLWLASGDLVGLLAPTAVVAFLCLTLITWTGIWYGALTVLVLLKRRHRRCAVSVALAFVSLLLVLWLASGDLVGLLAPTAIAAAFLTLGGPHGPGGPIPWIVVFLCLTLITWTGIWYGALTVLVLLKRRLI